MLRVNNLKLSFKDFCKNKSLVNNTPGIYQILTNEGCALKVGISKNLRQRLYDHIRSPDLILINKNLPPSIFNTKSKKSILAKHLYFDEAITDAFNLKTRLGRQEFLTNHCYLLIEYTPTKHAARLIEIELETSGFYRYAKRVLLRQKSE